MITVGVILIVFLIMAFVVAIIKVLIEMMPILLCFIMLPLLDILVIGTVICIIRMIVKK